MVVVALWFIIHTRRQAGKRAVAQAGCDLAAK